MHLMPTSYPGLMIFNLVFVLVEHLQTRPYETGIVM